MYLLQKKRQQNLILFDLRSDPEPDPPFPEPEPDPQQNEAVSKHWKIELLQIFLFFKLLVKNRFMISIKHDFDQ